MAHIVLSFPQGSVPCKADLRLQCQFSIGRKDTPVRISRGSYIAKLRWLRQRYVTLCRQLLFPAGQIHPALCLGRMRVFAS